MITKLIYNWHQASIGGTCSDIIHNELYYVAEVGQLDTMSNLEVKEIVEHSAQGEGDRWYYCVKFINGEHMKVFNPNIAFGE
jgi:hypothetical protein